MKVLNRLKWPAAFVLVPLLVFSVAYTVLEGQGGNQASPPPEVPERTMFDVISRGDVQEIQKWLDDGADPNQQHESGIPLLSFAILGSGRTSTLYTQVQTLLNAGANPNITDRFGRTALHFAAQYGAGDAVTQALIDAGVSTDVRDQSGNSALELSAAFGRDGARSAIERATTVRPEAYDEMKAVGAMNQKVMAATSEAERKQVYLQETLKLKERGLMTASDREALLEYLESIGIIGSIIGD